MSSKLIRCDACDRTFHVRVHDGVLSFEGTHCPNCGTAAEPSSYGTVGIERERLIGTVQFPQAGDPTANAFAVYYAPGGVGTIVTEFDLHTYEILDQWILDGVDPPLLAKLLDLGGVSPADAGPEQKPDGPIYGGPESALLDPNDFRSDGENDD